MKKSTHLSLYSWNNPCQRTTSFSSSSCYRSIIPVWEERGDKRLNCDSDKKNPSKNDKPDWHHSTNKHHSVFAWNISWVLETGLETPPQSENDCVPASCHEGIFHNALYEIIISRRECRVNARTAGFRKRYTLSQAGKVSETEKGAQKWQRCFCHKVNSPCVSVRTERTSAWSAWNKW